LKTLMKKRSSRKQLNGDLTSSRISEEALGTTLFERSEFVVPLPRVSFGASKSEFEVAEGMTFSSTHTPQKSDVCI